MTKIHRSPILGAARTAGAGVCLALCLAAVPGHAPGASETPLVSLERIARGLERPVSLAHAGDGSGRLFIVQQGGEVLVHDGREVLPKPFLDLSELVSCCGERGLLDIAFHPDYAQSGLLFVHYSDRDDDTVIARYRVSEDPNAADPASAEILLRAEQPYSNHNGGQMDFGPDGYLYISLGDGGSGGDPGNRAQDLGTLLGKMLRIDVNTPSGYAIPPDNPFIEVPGARAEIWALGLRNAWRFSFDRKTGDLFIADVGQNRREEISFQPAGSPGGENYGWRLMEGSGCYEPRTGCDDGSFVLPILEVEHGDGDCSITGGYRYRGARTPEAVGLYFYGDYCSGRIWAGAEGEGGAWSATEVLDTRHDISSFGEDEAGELYIADHGWRGGAVYRLVLDKSLGGLGSGRR